MARKFGANCSKCQRSTEQQQSIKCFKIHSKDLLQNNDFHITSSIFLLSSVLVFYFFLILFFNSIVYRFFIARIFGVLPEYFRDWGGCRPPRPPGSYAYVQSLKPIHSNPTDHPLNIPGDSLRVLLANHNFVHTKDHPMGRLISANQNYSSNKVYHCLSHNNSYLRD